MACSTSEISGNNGLSSEINITPLIDVLLVMLIIFMVIVPEMPGGLKSALPSVAAAGVVVEAADRPILVQVVQNQIGIRYLVDGSPRRERRLRRYCWSSCRDDLPGRYF